MPGDHARHCPFHSGQGRIALAKGRAGIAIQLSCPDPQSDPPPGLVRQVSPANTTSSSPRRRGSINADAADRAARFASMDLRLRRDDEAWICSDNMLPERVRMIPDQFRGPPKPFERRARRCREHATRWPRNTSANTPSNPTSSSPRRRGSINADGAARSAGLDPRLRGDDKAWICSDNMPPPNRSRMTGFP